MTSEQRAAIARDLLLEWIIGAEPFVGGEGKTGDLSNKSPRVYLAMAAVGRCLGIPEFVDTALRGYEGVRDLSFSYDGLSHESPGYTNMYLIPLVDLAEVLHGYQWPASFDKRRGSIDLYGTDSRLRLMFRSVVDQLRGDGRFLPLADTETDARPGAVIADVGTRRYPEYYAGERDAILGKSTPTDYAVFNLQASDLVRQYPLSPPEILYPAWMVDILRHGRGPDASALALSFSPHGGHRHTDNLALYYADRGSTVLDELGYVGDMPTKPWAGSTLSHNLVIVDDAPQTSRGRVPRFRLMATTPDVSVLEASSECYEQCSEYRRLVALVKGPEGQTFAVDIFRVAGGKKHAYQVVSGLASSEAAESGLAFDGLSMPAEAPLPNVGNSVKREDLFGLRDVRANAAPPASWQASWRQTDRSYRLWMLSPVCRVEASNGPGQTTRLNGGRRARYLNAVREGESLKSAFVAIHEPSGRRSMQIRHASRLAVPADAGPNAVALKIESEWGTYYVLSEFDRETEIDGVRFHGQFGVVCRPASGKRWLMSVGATTLQQGSLGFAHKRARWTGNVTGHSDTKLVANSARPADWPAVPKGCQSYIAVDTERYRTGFAAADKDANHILVERFPLPETCRSFDWPALRYQKQ